MTVNCFLKTKLIKLLFSVARKETYSFVRDKVIFLHLYFEDELFGTRFGLEKRLHKYII